MALQKLLGVDTLDNRKQPSVSVADLEGKVVLLYFGASWCPPCAQFTPQLTKFYNNLKAEKKHEFELIYVSGDKAQDEFDEYRKDMPWLAMPFAKRREKEKLSRRVKVGGIPTVVIVGKDGKVVTTKARNNVMKDPEGKDFPWIPKSIFEVLGSGPIMTHDNGKLVTVDDLRKMDAFALYFSAHWCPPCRAFTPRLATIYKKLKAQQPNVEIIFCSNDNTEEDFAEYWSEQPWAAIPLGDERVRDLSEIVGLESIPTLVTVKGDGTVISKAARSVADEDVDAERFPWVKNQLPPVAALEPSDAAVEALNNNICVMLNVNGQSNKETALLEFRRAAERFHKDENGKLDDDDKVCFFTVESVQQEQLYSKVLNAVGGAKPKHGVASVLYMLLPGSRAHQFLGGELSEQNIFDKAVEFMTKQNAE